MKKSILALLVVPALFAFSQDTPPKKANTIELPGVSFREVANGLLDAGYTFEKIDSSFQTIKTDWKDGTGKNKWNVIRLLIRVKDSTAIITGEWYSRTVIGHRMFGIDMTIENTKMPIEYASVNPAKCFFEMYTFAASFNKPFTYTKK